MDSGDRIPTAFTSNKDDFYYYKAIEASKRQFQHANKESTNFYSNYMDDSFYNGLQLNPRQLQWIKKRKIRRDSLDAIMIEQDKNYTHESRHRHAMNRMRASSGRFLTKEETREMMKNKKNAEEKN